MENAAGFTGNIECHYMTADNNKIYFHIGTHKTGTSAIQDFLRLNIKVLGEEGFLCPRQSRRSYYTHTDDGYIVASANRNHYLKLTKLCRTKQKNILVSSETFSYLKNVSDLQPLFDRCNVKVICYLRRQDNVLQSMYNQSVKRGGDYKSISEYPTGNLDYFKLLEQWASVFGKTNIIVRVYEKRQFFNHNLFEDFLGALGLKLTNEYQMPENNPNPRLSAAVLEYMRHMNSLLEDVKSAIKLKKSLVKFSAEYYSDASTAIFFDHSLLTGNQKRSILARFADSNLRVAKEYLGRQDGRLFYEELADTPQSLPPQEILTDEMFLEITRYLWGNRANRKNLIKPLNKDVSKKDTFTKTAHRRFSDALKRIT